MYNSNISNRELLQFHKQVQVTDILPVSSDAFINDDLKYFPLFYFKEIKDASEDMRLIGDGKCILSPDPYIHFVSDENLEGKVRLAENSLFMNIGDTLTEEEYNYMVWYLRTFHPFNEKISLAEEHITGEFADYDFEWNSAIFLDEGVLITDDESILGTVTLTNPFFTNSTYVLHLKIVDYDKTNIQTGDDESITVSTLEIPLIRDVPVDIDFTDADFNNIVSFDAEVEIVHDQPVIERAHSILCRTDESSYYIDGVIPLKATYLDGFKNPVSGMELTFKKGDTVLGTAVTNENGVATYNYLADEIGTFSFSALYDTVVSDAVSISVLNNVSSVSLSSSRLVVVKDNYVLFSANVIDVNGNPVAGKTVTFQKGSSNIGTATTDNNGVAILNYKSTTTGTHTYKATIRGVTSSGLSVKTKTSNNTNTVTLTANPNPAPIDTEITLTIKAVDSDNDPVAERNVKLNNGTIVGVTDKNGECIIPTTITFSQTGTYTVNLYSIDGKKGSVTITVIEPSPVPVVTTVGLSASSSSVTIGSTVTFSAIVKDQHGDVMEGETVTFKRGTSTLGTGVTNSSGVATYAYVTDTAGNLSFTGVCGNVSSSVVNVSVSKISTTTSLSASSQSVIVGETISLSGAVSVGTSGLSVKIYRNGSLIDTVSTTSDGVFSKSVTATSGGTETFYAVYEGSGTYDGSQSGNVSVTVEKISSSVTLSTSSASVTVGDSFTLSGNLTGGGSGLSGATLKLYDGATLVDSTVTTASGGSFSKTITPSLADVGSHSYTVVFEGDSTYTNVTSSAVSVTVVDVPVPVPDSVSLVGSKSILSYADSESCVLTATVLDENDDPLEGETVTFKKGTVTLGTDTTDANGEATYTYSSAGVGDVSFTAEVGSLVSETYGVQDCRFFDESSSSNVSKYGSSSSFSYDSTEQAYYISTSSVKNITRDSVVGDFDFEISMDIKMTDNKCNFYCGESTSSYECQGHLIGTYSSSYKGIETYYTNTSQSVTGRTRFVGYSFDTNKWYTYKVTRNDNVLTVQVLDGDTVIATAIDNNVTGTSNSVAWHLYMVQGNMYWKNIKFKPL